jgi:aspartokinase
MITVAHALQEILDEESIIPVGTDIRHLNISALARSLQSDVEARVQKSVQTTTLIVALSRILSKQAHAYSEPEITLNSFSIQSALVELTYSRTSRSATALQRVYTEVYADKTTFFTSTQGVGEISIIADATVADQIRAMFAPEYPTLYVDHLSSLTVRFSDRYVETPNIIFTILSVLAGKQVNVIEVVSTASELTFILQEEDLHFALELLRKRFLHYT